MIQRKKDSLGIKIYLYTYIINISIDILVQTLNI